ncbi:MAG: hypothetical protein R3F60_09915 [bacterium]
MLKVPTGRHQVRVQGHDAAAPAVVRQVEVRPREVASVTVGLGQ